MEITKEWIDKLSDYRKEKRIYPMGSVLMVPKGTEITEEMKTYALEKDIEIKIDLR